MAVKEPIAIIGIGCRFPGGADSPAAFWKMLCAGVDAIREIPPDRWNIAAHYDPTLGRAEKSISKWGGFIANIDCFDPGPFGISPREADCMDPQQRLLLEASWEAFEDGGLPLEKLRGSPTGVFVGISTTDYTTLQNAGGERSGVDIYSVTGSAISIAANRISYCFDLRGPSLAMDTACSSALTACHIACQSLWRGGCSQAVVAGVNAILNHDSYIAFSRMSMLSPDGRCKAFDASANGFVRAEGVGAVILKPLSAARADGDKIYALIRGTAANQDGRTNGIVVPSPAAQEALVRQACREAEISTADIGYVEAHGTGTPVGDPIEANALGAALGDGRKNPCLVGSVKTNIGHLEAAAGIASLIKVALVLKHKTIPPSLHFKNPNPGIDFEKLNLRVVQKLEPFPENSGRLLAGINAFGFGGANAHAILEAAPCPVEYPLLVALRMSDSIPQGEPPREQNPPAETSGHKPLLLALSAHSPEALRAAARNYRVRLAEPFADARAICGAAATRRSHFAHRLCLAGGTREELLERLGHFLAGEADPAIVCGEVSIATAPVFVFSGQGPQWWGMGRELLREEPLFTKKIQQCDQLFRELGGWSLVEELSRDEEDSRLQQTAFAQPAIFALQVALADLWRSWGVRPSAVVGHSVGEIAAAHVAGVLSLREAARVIFHRARCMNAAPGGRMLAAGLDAKRAGELAAEFPGEVAVAAFNSPNSVTFSGKAAPLEAIARTLEAQGVFNRFLQVKYAFHSHQMEPIKDELLLALGRVETSPAQLKIYSAVTGQPADGRDFTADYWWHNVRGPVHFGPAIAELIGQGHNCFLELNAHPALAVSISETLAHRLAAGKVFFSLRRKEPERETLLANLAALHVAGAPVDWKSFYPDASAETALPAYPWQRERHWRETGVMRAARLDAPAHPLLNVKLRAATPAWNTWLNLDALAYLKDHRVQEHVVFPGAGYVEMALGIGRVLYNSLPLEIEDVEFPKALFLPEGKEPKQLQSAFSAVDGNVKFSSRAGEDGGEWTLNATAKLHPLAGARPAPVDLKHLKKSLAEEFTSAQVYATYEDLGFSYGPAFRGIETVWRRNGESLGKITLPKQLMAGIEKFRFHPALLDACFQTLIFAAPVSHRVRKQILLPARIDRVSFFGRPGNSVFCHAKLVAASSHAITWNFQILDRAGRVLVEAEGFRVQAVRGMNPSRSGGVESWLYETKWAGKPFSSRAAAENKRAKTGTWLLFADRSGVAEKLAAALKKQGGHPLLVFCGEKFQRTGGNRFEIAASSPADLQQLLAEANLTNGKSLAGVVHLWSLDVPDAAGLDSHSLRQAESAGCHSVLHLVQLLARENSAPRLWLVTSGAQAVNIGENISVAQSPLLGLGRTITTEFPKWSCRLVDVDSGNAEKIARQLLREISIGDGETEVAWRGQSRFANRLVRTSLELHPPRAPLSPNPGYRLEIPASGVMDELALLETPRRRPGPHEVEIEICAAALNFRDVMKSLGIYPMDSDIDLLLGDECSGPVTAVGKGVKQFKIGDEVIAAGAGCFASHLTIPAPFVVHKPARISFEEAATIPVAFMTAWHALHHLGKIRRGEKILIHVATGGVGLAAIQIARLAGAEIFATAGNDEKRNYLRKLGIRHVMDSRSTAFAGEIIKITKGAGVDLVLNSLAGDAIAKGLSALAPGGRFLEIGKRDIYANTAIGLRPFRKNLSLFVIDMGQVMAEQPDTVQHLLQTLMKLFRAGKLQTLPRQTLPVSRAADAFRLMAQAKHIGKIVLTMQNVSVTPRRPPPDEKIQFPARASYLITGGLGGFGLAVAKWLVASGARNLVLTGRSGAATAEAKRAVAELKRRGAKVLVVKADVAEEKDVARIFTLAARKLPPLRGIFHAAMVLDDGLLTQLTAERFSRVLSPKAAGAWNLHTASAALPLDHFVMFSSVSALVGAAGQANYAAANCFLDALAHHRRALGLPALTVNWGALGEVGFLARNAKVAEHLAAHGVHGIAPAQATEMLGRLLQSSATQIGFMRVDWQKFFGAAAGAILPPKFSEVFTASTETKSGDDGEARNRILSAPAAERPALAAAWVGESAAKVLRTSAAKLEANRPLKEMGLDSLMAFELLNRLETQFGVSLPPSRFSANATINNLAVVVLEILGGAAEPAEEKVVEARTAANGSQTISAGEADAGGNQLLTLRAGRSGGPVFFIHPAGGLTSIYDELAAQLPAGLPVHAIQSRVPAGAGEERDSIEALASDYAGLIARQQPAGALRLAGFSVGGLFALATAGELERRGRTISLVGLIDAPMAVLDPHFPRELVLKNLIAEVYDYFTGELKLFQPRGTRGLSGSMTALAEKTAAAKDEAAQLRLVMDWLAEHGLETDDDGDSGVKKFFEVFNRHANLVRAVQLETVAAPVWLWRAGASRLTSLPTPPEICERITRGGFAEQLLDGRHFELMHPPLVKILAARFAAALAETEGARAIEPAVP
jgi:acyl transferase domain-containing protein/thioesterase domain-containing protein/acyl carrier protein